MTSKESYYQHLTEAIGFQNDVRTKFGITSTRTAINELRAEGNFYQQSKVLTIKKALLKKSSRPLIGQIMLKA